jgi:hypothetical protein
VSDSGGTASEEKRVAAMRADPTNCPRCWGCGRIADSDNAEPWICWEMLPSPSNFAVVMGIVKPLPCPACGGTGKRAGEER